jgi:hypothetical protein
MFYASRLASNKFHIPIKAGQEVQVKDLNNLQYGYYKVHIDLRQGDQVPEQLKKMFAISKYHMYTHYSIFLIQELQKTYPFIKITLNTTDTYNAYVYDEKDLISGDMLFDRWYKALQQLKSSLPKNPIVKMLSSSFWGHLISSNVCYKTEQEVEDEKLDIDNGDDSDYRIEDYFYDEDKQGRRYILQNMNHPYKHPFRIKSFLTSFCRNEIAQVARLAIDNVLRIHTDGICFTEPFTFKIANFIIDEKKTGMIKFPVFDKKDDADDENDC